MRPIKAGIDYFLHPTNSLSAPRMEALIQTHGIEAYGVYYALVEILYASKDCQLDLSDPLVYDPVRRRLGLRKSKFQSILHALGRLSFFDESKLAQSVVFSSEIAVKRCEIEETRNRHRTRSEADGGHWKDPVMHAQNKTKVLQFSWKLSIQFLLETL